MEVFYKGIRINFRNLKLALIFMGILMLVIGYLLPPEKNAQFLTSLRTFGGFFILTGFLMILIPFLIEEVGKLNS